MLPAVRLDRIDVFTTQKIQWTTWRTKASLYQWLGRHCPELASNFRRYLELTGCGQGHRASSSRFNWREDTYWLQGGGHSIRLAMIRPGRARPGNKAETSQKLSEIKRKEHIWREVYIFLSDGMEIGWEQPQRIKNKRKQPHFKVHSYSKIVSQQRASLNQHTQWVSYPFLLFFSLIPKQGKKMLALDKVKYFNHR